jgi:MFS family permease
MRIDNWGCLRLSPIAMLIFFGFTEALIYIDRSGFGALVPILKSDDGLGLSSSEMGIVGSAFIFGYMAASPLFGHFSQYYHPLFLMGLGLIILSLAELASGLARSFWVLLIARAFTGVGDASIISLAPPFISDIAPKERKNVWVASFYGCLSIGNGLGFVYGNYFAMLLGAWYWPLLIESILLIPSAVIAFVLYKDPKFMNVKEVSLDSTLEASTLEATVPLHKRIAILLKNKPYVILVLGFATYSFTYGGWVFWSTDFIVTMYGISAGYISIILGSISLIFGLSGALVGSYFLDRRMKKISNSKSAEGIDLSDEATEMYRKLESTRVLAIALFLGGVVGAVGVITGSLIPFLLCYCIAEFFQKM